MQTEQAVRLDGPPARPTDRWRWAWLGTGALLSLFAVHGRYDIAAAAWLFPVFLLRFTRTGPAVTGLLAVWAVTALGGVFWMVETAVPMTPVVVAGITGLTTLTSVPFVVDRVLAARAGTVGSLLLFPAAVAACEFLMTLVSPFGTAFGVLAPTQHDHLALLQVVGVTGPYGVAFLIGGFATVVNHLWANPRRAGTAVAVYTSVLALVLLGGGARLAFAPPSGGSVRVAGISPDTSVAGNLSRALGGLDGTAPERVAGQDLSAAFEQVNVHLLERTREAAQAGAKIVFWSEQAANVLARDEPALLERAAAVAREHRIYLQAAVFRFLPEAPYSANRVYLFGPGGERIWEYDKAHPIPGLEHYPPGDGVVPVAQTPYGRLASVICFDADFPELLRVDADIMLVPARDWAEIGPVHSQKANLRAVENGYALVRQAEFGVSGAFDPQGRVLTAHDHTASERHVVFTDVPTRGTATLYRPVGDVFAWLCLAGVVLVAGRALYRRKG